MFKIVLILSVIVIASLMPVKLSQSAHFPLFPLTFVRLTIEPNISTLTIKQILFKLSLIVLDEFVSSNMFKDKVIVVNKRFIFDLRRARPWEIF
jgi:hypothetical protein